MRIDELARVSSLAGGDTITQARVTFSSFLEEAAFLRKMAETYKRNIAIRELAIRIVFPSCVRRDEFCQAMAIGQWVQDHIHYVHEGFETFCTPTRTVKLGAGDCDDMTTLTCALLGSIGIENRMVIVNINGKWAHIFPVALARSSDGTRDAIPLDASLSEPISLRTNPLRKLRLAGRDVRTLVV